MYCLSYQFLPSVRFQLQKEVKDQLLRSLLQMIELLLFSLVNLGDAAVLHVGNAKNILPILFCTTLDSLCLAFLSFKSQRKHQLVYAISIFIELELLHRTSFDGCSACHVVQQCSLI